MARLAPDWPRMMRRATAAAYCDLSEGSFERGGGTDRKALTLIVLTSSRVKLDRQARFSERSGTGAACVHSCRGNRETP